MTNFISMIDFPFILLFLTIGSGAIWFIDTLLFAKKRKEKTSEEKPNLPILVEYSKSLFPVFLLVIIIRTFLGSLYVVPSGSLEPTVTPGDYILVTQFPYGLHLPVWNNIIYKTGKPKLGEIVVFHWPVNPYQVDYIKRVVGLPGDTISYINKVLYINGKPAKQKFITKTLYGDAGLSRWVVEKRQENLLGVKHDIYICPASSTQCPGNKTVNFYNLRVPKGEYLMMGDNRDDSDDGRYWGFVPAKDLIGKAKFIVFSWNSNADWLHKVRWSRIGTKL